MRVQQLSPNVGNFQVGFLPSGLGLLEDDNIDNVTKTQSPAAPEQTSPPLVQFVGVTLRSRRRRVLFRRSISKSSDVSAVLLCDLRVQQLLWNDLEHGELPTLPSHCGPHRNEEGSNHVSWNKGKEAAERESGGSLLVASERELGGSLLVSSESECSRKGGSSSSAPYTETDEAGSEKYSDDYGYVISQEDGLDIGRTEAAGEARDGEMGPGRKQNDYRREIDLAHHILQMELEDGHNSHEEEDGYNGAGKMAGGEHTTAALALFQHVPSTVRFNDALVCTSKDVQILKSGTIKMMRLTVICHSDLHYYQNHPLLSTREKHRQSQKYFSDTTTPTKETGPVGPFASKPATSRSSSTASFETLSVTNQTEDGKRERKLNITTTGQTASHGTEKKSERNCDEKSKKEGEHPTMSSSKVSSSSSHNISHHDSNHEETDLNEKSKECKTNWKRLQDKIRVIFQTYDIHVGKNTLVNLKCCPLASFQANLSPAVNFVFVEDCEITKNKKTDTSVDIGKVSGKTEIIITNVHHISYYKRIVEMDKSQGSERDETVHLYGLDHVAKILKGMIKTSGGGGIGHVENPVVSYIAATGGGASLTSFSGLLTEFSHGLLISGPSGCGKVAVVREAAKKLGAHLLSFNPSYYGVEDPSAAPFRLCHRLTDIFASALVSASRYQTVLLFPRIHLLFQKDKNLPTSNGKNNINKARVLHHLCKLFDSIPGGFRLTVVGTTDKTHLVPLLLRMAGRLEKEVIISPPNESERLAILQGVVRDKSSFRSVNLAQFASETPGYVTQDLLKVIRLAFFKSQEEGEDGVVGQVVTEEHMRYAVRRVVPSVLEGVLGVVDIQRAISLDHIAGLHSVKLDLIKAIVWPLKHPEAFLRMGISPPKGILLYGPPGNCKTTLVRAVAATHQTNFLSVSAAELFSSGVGDSEKIVAHLFHRARMASPCILFIDELESIVGSRQNSGKKQTGTNESILSMLLTEMDGVGTTRIQHGNGNISSPLGACSGPVVLVVAATNRPDLIDPALLRPGRFDKLVKVPPLNMTGRNELLTWCSKSIPFDTNLGFMELAECTEYFSGADLVNLCREAAFFALSDTINARVVTQKHLKMARSAVGPSLNPEMIRRFHEYGSNLQQQESELMP